MSPIATLMGLAPIFLALFWLVPEDPEVVMQPGQAVPLIFVLLCVAAMGAAGWYYIRRDRASRASYRDIALRVTLANRQWFFPSERFRLAGIASTSSWPRHLPSHGIVSALTAEPKAVSPQTSMDRRAGTASTHVQDDDEREEPFSPNSEPDVGALAAVGKMRSALVGIVSSIGDRAQALWHWGADKLVPLNSQRADAPEKAVHDAAVEIDEAPPEDEWLEMADPEDLVEELQALPDDPEMEIVYGDSARSAAPSAEATAVDDLAIEASPIPASNPEPAPSPVLMEKLAHVAALRDALERDENDVARALMRRLAELPESGADEASSVQTDDTKIP